MTRARKATATKLDARTLRWVAKRAVGIAKTRREYAEAAQHAGWWGEGREHNARANAMNDFAEELLVHANEARR
jgi:hypothetical protein